MISNNGVCWSFFSLSLMMIKKWLERELSLKTSNLIFFLIFFYKKTVIIIICANWKLWVLFANSMSPKTWSRKNLNTLTSLLSCFFALSLSSIYIYIYCFASSCKKEMKKEKIFLLREKKNPRKKKRRQKGKGTSFTNPKWILCLFFPFIIFKEFENKGLINN